MKLDGEIENIRRIQDYARRTIEIENERYKGIIETIVLQDLIWDESIESGAFGQLNPATSKSNAICKIKQLKQSKHRTWR